ncbi:MAG: NUDIX domain-containing protein [Myxococcota bacterium]
MNGPSVRTDLVTVLTFRTSTGAPGAEPMQGIEWLQLRRAGEPMAGTWQPVMGSIEAGESATEAAIRELREETGFVVGGDRGDGGDGGDPRGPRALWQLDGVHPFFLAQTDSIVLSPTFVVQVAPGTEPTLNREHDDARWVSNADADEAFMWPFQLASIAEARRFIHQPCPARRHLRVWPLRDH